MKELFLLRGTPGAGKTELAKSIGGYHYEADMYFVDDDGNYKWDGKKLKQAHEWCRNSVEATMEGSEYNPDMRRIIVSNTFTRVWEMQAYLDLAKKYNYRVYSLIVENRHGGENSHGVSPEKIEEMKQRFEISL
jgi:predicted kinase